jgi:hypothetical protein
VDLQRDADGVVRGLRLQGRTIVGPAIVFFPDPSSIAFRECAFGDPAMMLWEIEDGRPGVSGVVALADCQFVSCTFTGVGIAGPRALLDQFREQVQPA